MNSDGTRRVPPPFGPTAVARELVERIRRSGPITFAEFMQEALYSERGYYRGGGRIAASGDYFTSPSAHPAFGALIALQLRDLWRQGGRRPDFTVVEMGAGDGLLARDITRYAERIDGEFAAALKYRAFDAVPEAGVHREVEPLSELPKGIYGCVLSNELLDAFPVHRFVIEHGRVRELLVGVDGDELVEVDDGPAPPLIGELIGPFADRLPTGYKGEVNLEIDAWAEGVGQVLESGHLITIDYGFERQELYSSSRISGSLRCYYRHTLSQDPLVRVGLQDMTAHVDFTSVDGALGSRGFSKVGRVRQSAFLVNLGAKRWIDQLRQMELGEQERRANLAGMRQILDSTAMGRFWVDVHARNADGLSVKGIEGGSADDETGDVPLLATYPGHVDVGGGTPSSGQWFEVPSFEHLFSDQP